MFEKCDLERSIERKSYEKSVGELKSLLASLQRVLHERRIPVIIVLEGWNAAGITNLTHEIIKSLDSRGFTLHAIERPTDEERARPFMWRFWMRLPGPGTYRYLCPELVQPGYLRGDAGNCMEKIPRLKSHDPQ